MATARLRFVSRGAIDLAHPARADLGSDFIGTEARAGGKGQRSVDYRVAACRRGDYSCLMLEQLISADTIASRR